MKKFHRVIQFNHEDWLKPYIDMNTDLRQKAKNNFENYFFQVTEKTEILNLSQQKKRRSYLVSEPNYHTAKCFTKRLIINRNKKLND